MSQNRSRGRNDATYVGGSTTDSLFRESQNDLMMEDLADKVTQLHMVSLDIQGTVEDQNRLLDESHSNFDRFGGLLNATQTRVKQLLNSKQRRIIFYVTLSFLFIFLVFYFMNPSSK